MHWNSRGFHLKQKTAFLGNVDQKGVKLVVLCNISYWFHGEPKKWCLSCTILELMDHTEVPLLNILLSKSSKPSIKQPWLQWVFQAPAWSCTVARSHQMSFASLVATVGTRHQKKRPGFPKHILYAWVLHWQNEALLWYNTWWHWIILPSCCENCWRSTWQSLEGSGAKYCSWSHP